MTNNEKYQREKFEWYRKDQRSAHYIEFFALILYLVVPIILCISSFMNYHFKEKHDRIASEKAFQKFTKDTDLQKQIFLLGTRPSAYHCKRN